MVRDIALEWTRATVEKEGPFIGPPKETPLTSVADSFKENRIQAYAFAALGDKHNA